MQHARNISRQVALVILSVISLYPVWFMLSTALKTPQYYTLNPTGLPLHPTMSNFSDVFSQGRY